MLVALPVRPTVCTIQLSFRCVLASEEERERAAPHIAMRSIVAKGGKDRRGTCTHIGETAAECATCTTTTEEEEC